MNTRIDLMLLAFEMLHHLTEYVLVFLSIFFMNVNKVELEDGTVKLNLYELYHK